MGVGDGGACSIASGMAVLVQRRDLVQEQRGQMWCSTSPAPGPWPVGNDPPVPCVQPPRIALWGSSAFQRPANLC